MAVLVRIDVDRPYGRAPLLRHVLSRLSSDLCLPRIKAIGYLEELAAILGLLNRHAAPAHVFFRRCTLPSEAILNLIKEGGHEIGLHLENSRSFDTFCTEKRNLEHHLGREVLSFSKHGSGGHKYGRTHYAPYEPDKYVQWGGQAGMRLFLGNLEDPTLPPVSHPGGLCTFPSAFWLETPWRDTTAFPVSWLLSEAAKRDIVLLIHPENVLASPALVRELEHIVSSVGATLAPLVGGPHE